MFFCSIGWSMTANHTCSCKETKKRFCDEAILERRKRFGFFTTQRMEGKTNGKLLEDHYSVIHQMLQIENYTIFLTNVMESP